MQHKRQADEAAVGLPDVAELHCRSNFSFLTGASQPAELVQRAHELGYRALALTDECSLAGVVRAHEALKELNAGKEQEGTKESKAEKQTEAEEPPFHLIIGAEMRLTAAPVAPLPAGAVSAAAASSQAGGPWARLKTKSKPRSHAGRLPAAVGAESPVDLGAESKAGLSAELAIDGNAGQAAEWDDGPAPGHLPLRHAWPHPHRPTGDGARLVLLAQTHRGYSNLSRWISLARRRAEKGSYLAYASDLEGKAPNAPWLAGLGDCLALLVVDGPEAGDGTVTPPQFETVFAQAMWLKTCIGADRCGLALALRHRRFDDERVDVARRVSELSGLPIVATGDVLMHSRSRKPLQDVLAATRHRCTVAESGTRLESNGEAHLRSRARLAELYEPAWLQAAVAWASRCTFSLSELEYEYPQELVPKDHTATTWLRELTERGLLKRYRDKGRPEPTYVRQQVEHELALIQKLRFEAYFLTVADLVHWARGQGILCQGRGSAANSIVCYALQVTEVDPKLGNLLFERFISAERNEPPDIDIDFEHQRREEVIQYIYAKYSRYRAAMTGVVISYRGRSCLRDVGRALGFDLDRIEAVTKQQPWWTDHPGRFDPERLREHGFDPDAPLVKLWAELASQLRGFPRHLSQHPGGFLIASEDVSSLVPVENATMEGRTVIQWDKDDLDTLKLIKVDVLALGMLSAIRRALAWIGEKQDPKLTWVKGRRLEMDDLPQEDPAVYDMLCDADAIGVFQVESRAQLSMLPRLRPRCYYDLVIEVAIVRPGPIQGGMVHPYLKRRSGEEPVVYPSPEVEKALERTKGVPIFQEQVMQLAMLAADFTPGEADQLRRAMAAWKRKGGLGPFHDKLVHRMVAKGYSLDYAESIFRQIEGFGEYGFPESHAASFALLVYVSAWIKRHHPDAFLLGLLNSQPMGFYAPAQLVRDARAHGVCVRPVDVTRSEWDSTLEDIGPTADGDGAEAEDLGAVEAGRMPVQNSPQSVCPAPQTDPALSRHSPPSHTLRPVRLGFNRLSGFREDAAQRIVAARADAPFTSVEDLARRAELDAHALRLLADGNALSALAGHRREAAWEVAGVDTRTATAAVLRATRTEEPERPALEAPSAGATLLADYRRTGLSLANHPLALLRPRLAEFRISTSAELQNFRNGQLARASGLVTHRQRPQTAKGVIFVTLEDETGPVNVIVWPQVAEAQRTALLASRLLTVYGIWQRQGEVRHLVAKRLVDHSALLRELDAESPALKTTSRDFR
ncbi:MAG TPA: error-prone DNA polymerase [Ideonella sp.]|uniref:error-prone DNA polymerase n=1 Tax=Ideonella sp. TaxID=1929293 RepID=UPI002E31B076|nr:error-prone DNA polymerase [Ideonella sp.]HEX5686803.1 error-prone DNA polymerase [Ideonella sp.]